MRRCPRRLDLIVFVVGGSVFLLFVVVPRSVFSLDFPSSIAVPPRVGLAVFIQHLADVNLNLGFFEADVVVAMYDPAGRLFNAMFPSLVNCRRLLRWDNFTTFFRIQTDYYFRVNLERFPFDEYDLEVIFQVPGASDLYLLPTLSGISHAASIPGWTISRDRGLDPKVRTAFMGPAGNTTQLSVFVHLERPLLTSLIRFFLPPAFIILSLLAAFTLPLNYIGTNLVLSASAIIPLVLFHYNLPVPQRGYLTLADQFLTLCYLIILLEIAWLVLITWTNSKNEKTAKVLQKHASWIAWVLFPVLFATIAVSWAVTLVLFVVPPLLLGISVFVVNRVKREARKRELFELANIDQGDLFRFPFDAQALLKADTSDSASYSERHDSTDGWSISGTDSFRQRTGIFISDSNKEADISKCPSLDAVTRESEEPRKNVTSLKRIDTVEYDSGEELSPRDLLDEEIADKRLRESEMGRTRTAHLSNIENIQNMDQENAAADFELESDIESHAQQARSSSKRRRKSVDVDRQSSHFAFVPYHVRGIGTILVPLSVKGKQVPIVESKNQSIPVSKRTRSLQHSSPAHDRGNSREKHSVPKPDSMLSMSLVGRNADSAEDIEFRSPDHIGEEEIDAQSSILIGGIRKRGVLGVRVSPPPIEEIGIVVGSDEKQSQTYLPSISRYSLQNNTNGIFVPSSISDVQESVLSEEVDLSLSPSSSTIELEIEPDNHHIFSSAPFVSVTVNDVMLEEGSPIHDESSVLAQKRESTPGRQTHSDSHYPSQDRNLSRLPTLSRKPIGDSLAPRSHHPLRFSPVCPEEDRKSAMSTLSGDRIGHEDQIERSHVMDSVQSSMTLGSLSSREIPAHVMDRNASLSSSQLLPDDPYVSESASMDFIGKYDSNRPKYCSSIWYDRQLSSPENQSTMAQNPSQSGMEPSSSYSTDSNIVTSASLDTLLYKEKESMSHRFRNPHIRHVVDPRLLGGTSVSHALFSQSRSDTKEQDSTLSIPSVTQPVLMTESEKEELVLLSHRARSRARSHSRSSSREVNRVGSSLEDSQ